MDVGVRSPKYLMNLRAILERSHQVLTEQRVSHALIGGFALAVLGVPRATNDVDYLIEESQKETAKKALLGAGWKIELETDEVIHLGGPGNIDVLLARRPLSQQMLKNATPVPPLGINCLSAEAIIGLKIQAYKNDATREFQDKADIQSLIQKHGASLNWEEIKTYADLFDEMPFLEILRKRL
jgi:hypothetical protein